MLTRTGDKEHGKDEDAGEKRWWSASRDGPERPQNTKGRLRSFDNGDSSIFTYTPEKFIEP